MGCISSKQVVKAAAASPDFEYSTAVIDNGAVILEPSSKNPSGLLEYVHKGDDKHENRSREIKRSKKESSFGRGSFSFRLGFSHTEAEQVAAGWPSWLSSAAGEAIQGWVPYRADAFEKLDKIGQGTYSSVFKARQVKTGRIVALKKVRFDNFQPESIRFMAREITILRRLDHPNIIKLEGLITSRLSTSIYLVFEYMEHDLAGLVSCPNIKFSEAQVKCYMRQLLSGIEYCHLRGIMHRDIKTSNILVNNEGVLKLGDFGLANSLDSNNKQLLTSRVVTLWYRPPELLMGSTSYGVSVDLWSIGCVFAELHLGKPILKGRTEVEQLHKIFKLCGSPSDEFWKKANLPHASMFKPQQSYESSLREKCEDFPTTAVNLMDMFLSIEPYNRGTASSALMSEYFRTKPHACDPSSLPKYPPNKEIDAKNRDEAKRKKTGVTGRAPGTTQKQRRVRKTSQEPKSYSKSAQKEQVYDTKNGIRNTGTSAHPPKAKSRAIQKDPLKPSIDTISEASQVNASAQWDESQTVPVHVTTSANGFAWMKRRADDATSTVSDGLKSQISAMDFANYTVILPNRGDEDLRYPTSSQDQHEQKSNQRKKIDLAKSFDASNSLNSSELSREFQQKMDYDGGRLHLSNEDQEKHIEFSGPLVLEPERMDERFQRNENHIRRASRKSRFEREK